MDRRSFLRFLLSTPLAATVDVEALIWVPKPIIVVPAMEVPLAYGRNNPNLGAMVAAAWEEYVGKALDDGIFSSQWLFEQLSKKE